ncbi:S41 family peptidase [Halonatronum saccharophilum]|uniref:S41 family peptidase n=1 Tax=Halonatronum saccharophilum TaxID=150060 RepID=UPI000489A0B1|nr:S41 family peptidase [Halonatronum saccharophilum]
MKKYKCLILLLLLSVLVGCRGGLMEENNLKLPSGLVWESYSNDYYSIKYPAKWGKAELNNNVGFAPMVDYQIGFEIYQSPMGSMRALNREVSEIIDRLVDNLKSVDRVELDGNEGYELMISYPEYSMKLVNFIIYKEGFRFDLIFVSDEGVYHDNLGIAKEMINSFKLFDFKEKGYELDENRFQEGIAKEILTSQEAISDAEYLWERLEGIHPNIYFKRDKEETKREFEQIIDILNSKFHWTKLELYTLLASFTAGVRDSHTELPINQTFQSYSFSNLVPLKVVFDNEGMVILDDFGNKGIPSGSRVISINGVDGRNISEDINGLISSQLNHWSYRRAERHFPIYFWLLYGESEEFIVEYKTEEERVKEARLKSISHGDYLDKQFKSQNNRDELLWSLDFPQERIALLTVNTFDENVINTFNEDFSSYKREMRRFFQEIRANETDYLIIDLRNNGGGSDRLARHLYEYITDTPYLIYSEILTKLSDYAVELGGAGLSDVARAGEDRVISVKKELIEPEDNDLRFNGEVYFLIGHGSYSAASDLAAVVKDFGTGVLVGQETGGVASAYGDLLRSSLPNSGLEFTVSYKHFIRPSGYDDGRGVLPDVEVEVDRIKETQVEDQVLTKVLELIDNR